MMIISSIQAIDIPVAAIHHHQFEIPKVQRLCEAEYGIQEASKIG